MWLVIRTGEQTGQVVEVTRPRFVIGRDPGCDLVLQDPQVSQRHAALERLPDGRLALHDLDSTNGTFVRGARVTVPAVLSGDEELRLGGTVLVLLTHPPSAPGTPPQPSRASETVVEAAIGTPSGAPREIEQPPGAPASRPSVIERIALRRSVRRLSALVAIVGVLAVGGVVVGVLFAVGVIGGDAEPQAPSIPELVAAAKPSVVLVKAAPSDDAELVGAGTGWVLDSAQGLVVTNAHVVNVGPRHAIAVGQEERPATVVAVAPCEDLALLRVEDTSGLVTLPLGSQSELEQGETVVALGYPVNAALADELTATSGVVSVVRTEWALESLDVPHLTNVVQTDAATNPGNSGGPLVTLEDRLVGVNTAGLTTFGERAIQGQGYAIGVDRVREIAPILREGRSLAWTGATFVFPALVDDLEGLGLPTDVPGLVVTSAVPGTAAAAAGLGQGLSLLAAIDGTPLDGTLQSYCGAVEGIESGQTATFTLYFPGESTPRDVVVGFE